MSFVKRSFHFLAFLLGGLVLAAVSPAMAMPAAPIASGTSRAVNEASNVLQQIRTDACHVGKDVDQLQMYAMEPMEYDGTLDDRMVNRIINRVNQMDRMLGQLRAIQSEVLPWQRNAINRITPPIIELTDFTQYSVNSLNKNRGHLFTSHLSEYATHMRMTDSRIKNSIQDFDEYASAKHEMRKMRKDLRLRSNS